VKENAVENVMEGETINLFSTVVEMVTRNDPALMPELGGTRSGMIAVAGSRAFKTSSRTFPLPPEGARTFRLQQGSAGRGTPQRLSPVSHQQAGGAD